ncbi:hypothetical protein D9M68_776110 [compost metagenome]
MRFVPLMKRSQGIDSAISKIILMIDMLQCIKGVLLKIPEGMIQVEEYRFISHVVSDLVNDLHDGSERDKCIAETLMPQFSQAIILLTHKSIIVLCSVTVKLRYIH